MPTYVLFCRYFPELFAGDVVMAIKSIFDFVRTFGLTSRTSAGQARTKKVKAEIYSRQKFPRQTKHQMSEYLMMFCFSSAVLNFCYSIINFRPELVWRLFCHFEPENSGEKSKGILNKKIRHPEPVCRQAGLFQDLKK